MTSIEAAGPPAADSPRPRGSIEFWTQAKKITTKWIRDLP
jgi:hypothetical protein